MNHSVKCKTFGPATGLDGEVAMIDMEWSSCTFCCAGSIDVSGCRDADLLLLSASSASSALHQKRRVGTMAVETILLSVEMNRDSYHGNDQ